MPTSGQLIEDLITMPDFNIVSLLDENRPMSIHSKASLCAPTMLFHLLDLFT